MAKFRGPIGYAVSRETEPGVWGDEIVERVYSGDFLRNTSSFQETDSLNDDISVSNEISIVSDSFAYQNFQSMRYVKYMGTKWKIRSVEVKYPRLILSIGGVYNAQQTGIE